MTARRRRRAAAGAPTGVRQTDGSVGEMHTGRHAATVDHIGDSGDHTGGGDRTGGGTADHTDRRRHERPRHARRSGFRRRVVAGLLVLGAVGVNVGGQLLVADARDDRDTAVAVQTASETRRDAFVDTGEATADAAQSAVAEAGSTTDERVEVATDAKAVDVEVDARREELAVAGAEVAGAAAQLDGARAGLAAITGQVGDLRACVGGVAGATAARGDTGAVIAAMQAVADPCRRAQAATGAVDPTARFPYDFPDPYVAGSGSGYYAYATNSAGGAVQLLRSGDLQTWAFAGTALDGVPGWAVPGATWAPSVLDRGSHWVLYYAVRHAESGRQCISAATSAGPEGPFVDRSAGPLVCELGEGGSIDPSPFVAGDGSAYLLWKAEGETAGGSAALRAQALTGDGLSLSGPVGTLATVDQGWEGRTVEGPSMVATSAGLVLLYSANRWDSAGYGVGAAWCDGPLGPCTKQGGPVLATSGPMVGPGGAEAFVDHRGAVRVAFHAWQGDDVGYPNDRLLHVGTLTVGRAGVTITP